MEEVQKQNMLLVRKVQEMNRERDELSMIIKTQNSFMIKMQQQNKDLKAQLANQGGAQMGPLPCFRCDGRKTEAD